MKQVTFTLTFVFASAIGVQARADEGPQPVGTPHVCTSNYPEAAVRAGAEGTTLLSFDIDAEGNVKNPTVAKTSGNKDLDDAAIQCAGNWKYKAATQKGKAATVPWQASVQWRLHNATMAQSLAHSCRKYVTTVPDIPRGESRITSIAFRVMPDGSYVDIKVTSTSGDATFDDAAVRCTVASHFPTQMLDWPQDGITGHASLDWSDLSPAAALQHAITPPVRIPDNGPSPSAK